MYKPDYFGTTPAQDLWALFNGIAKRLELDEVTQEKLLGVKPQASTAPAPSEEVGTRIELLKDSVLHTQVWVKNDDAEVKHVFNHPFPSFNLLTPLQLMGMSPAEIHKAVPGGTSMPHVNILWHNAPDAPDLGLQVIRAFTGRAAQSHKNLTREQAIRRTMGLIKLGQQ